MTSKLRGLLQLAVFIGLAIGLPALIPFQRESRAQSARDAVSVPDEITRLNGESPSIVIIGDSMAPCRVDPEILSGEIGQPVSLLSFNGSATAGWFLLFKNVVCAMDKPPRTVVFFFRDTYFHLPRYRTTGQRAALIDSLSLGAEPELESVLAGAPTGGNPILNETNDILDATWRVDGYRDMATEEVGNIALGWSKFGMDKDPLRYYINVVFSIENLRPDLAGDAADMDEDISYDDLGQPEWSTSPTAGFLPHLEKYAAEKKIRLVFYRVKQRDHTNKDWQVPEATRVYMEQFKAWAAANGHGFADESLDPEIVFEHFADGDHTREEDRPFISKRVARTLEPTLEK
ncbi:MAG: hypothetical protein ACKO2G_09640 [Verrucomicrobiales bacterium]